MGELPGIGHQDPSQILEDRRHHYARINNKFDTLGFQLGSGAVLINSIHGVPPGADVDGDFEGTATCQGR